MHENKRQVVGAFICEHEATASIQEGISILENWNPNWKLDYFMTDFDEKEINAIKSVFESCRVYLCDFHREQALTCWVNKHDHKVTHVKEEALARLRKIAHAESETDFENAVDVLYQSTISAKYSMLLKLVQ